MKTHLIPFFCALHCYLVSGISDDIYVEQYYSPQVARYDPGTHMTSNRFQNYHSLNGISSPHSSSSRQEYHQEQRYVNGQPVYEKKHERRYHDGELIHEDGYEHGNRDEAGVQSGYSAHGRGYGGSNSGQGSSSSSSSYYSSSSYGSEDGGNRLVGNSNSNSDFEDRFNTEFRRMRDRLHQGSSTIRQPAQGSDYQEERNEESQFINGEQVYRKKEERRFKNGQLVHDVSEQEGTPNESRVSSSNTHRAIGGTGAIYSTSDQSSEGYSSVNNPSDTSYRTSYWQSGPRRSGSQRITSSQRRTSTSTSTRPTYRGSNSFNTGPQVSAVPSIHTNYRNRAGTTRTNNYNNNSNSVYRSSYTPTNTIERVSQNNRDRNYHSRPRNTHMRPVSRRTQSSYSQNQRTSVSNKPMTNLGSRPTNSVTSDRVQQNGGIVGTYSEPYSDRSSTYPSRFSSYSAWSKWNEESGQPIRNYNSQSSTSSSQYHHRSNENNVADQQRSTYGIERTNSGSLDVSEHNSLPHADIQTERNDNRISYQTTPEPTYKFNPGFLYDDHRNEQIVRGSESHSSRIIESSTSEQSATGDQSSKDVSIGARPGGSIGLSLTVDVNEGDSVHLSPSGDTERYDINPLVDSSQSMESSSSSSSKTSNSNFAYRNSGSNTIDQQREIGYSSQSESGSGQIYSGVPIGASESSYGSTTISNRTTNTVSSRIQPLISSYKTETRTSKRYLNGKLVSETKYNKYYENGVLVHENQTERSRDEMETDGVNVEALDLTFNDLQRYGITENQDVPFSHSQRFEMMQEKEFIDGDQVYESTHERHFQDGELVSEEHDEKNKEQLANRPLQDRSINFVTLSNGNEKIRSNDNYDQYSNERYGFGQTQRSGIGEEVIVSVSPRTITRKTEIRKEQEFQNGEQVFDLHHERQFENGHLVDENLVERGPEDLEAVGHRDALTDILAGRTLNTALQSRQYNSHYSGPQYSYSRGVHGKIEPVNTMNSASSYSESTSQASSSYGTSENTDTTTGNRNSQGLIGTGLLSSGSLTNVIGGSGVHDFHTVANAEALNSASTNEQRSSGGSGYGYGGVDYSSSHRSSSSSSVQSGNSQYTPDISPHSQSHRREMEVEEHYENGQLVRGREEDKEWRNNQQIRNDVRRYGQGGETSGQRVGENSASESSYQSSSSSSSSSGGYLGVNHGGASSVGHGSEMSGSFSAGGYGGSVSGGSGGHRGGQSHSSFESSYSWGGDGENSHRREMEMEEHYENGQLIKGRKEDKEWSNDELIRHNEDHYGQGRSSTGMRSSLFQNSETGVCASQPCQNGASCITGARGYLCICTFGYRGTTCREAYCPTRYCRHEGVCELTPGGDHHCQCPSGYKGPRCEFDA